MNMSRAFLVFGSAYLLAGMGLGMHMGIRLDFALTPVHAHINLLGFALMMIFGLAYRLIPAMAGNVLGRAHFWLHQIGTLGFVVTLFLDLSGRMDTGLAGQILAVFSVMLFFGVILWTLNLLRNA